MPLDANNLQEIDEFSQEINCHMIILLKESEQGNVIVRSREKDRFHDKKISTSELVEHILKLNQDNFEPMNRIESKAHTTERADHERHDVNVTVNFVFETTDKYSSNYKRRYEHQVGTY